MFTLQTLPMPRVGLCTEAQMYVRPNGRAWYSYSEAAVILNAGDGVTTHTYFGVVPTGKWARHTALRSVEIVVGVAGDVEVEAVHYRRHVEPRVVAVGRHDGTSGEVILPLPDLATLAEGHVFLRVRAHGDGVRMRSMTVRTAQEPLRDVRLGVSVTTFNRRDYVRANVGRLDDYVAQRPDVANSVRLQIVDNARNLDLDPCSALQPRVIGNRNVGGAGGFARGLMELRNEGWATHVLFMDDDVSFEPDVVGRTIALLSYANDPQLCVVGGMLREEWPGLQFEAGAAISTRAIHIWQVNGFDRDLRVPKELVLNDDDEPLDYGGWWCFAFPIDLTDEYPLPVFVRGDDVCFGLRYCGGHLVAVNGIGVWHQDFAYKNGPVALFYENRNIPVVLSVSRPDYDAAALRKRLIERTLRFASAFKYDTATAVLDGVEAFLDGPDALVDVPADELHDRVRARYGAEQLSVLDAGQRSVPLWRPPRPPLPILWRAVSLITLGGHLLPHRLRRSGRTWAAAVDAAPAMATIGVDQMVYRHEATGEGFIARRDDERFKGITRRLRQVNGRLTREFDAAAEAWRGAYPKLVSDGFWRDQFGDDANALTPDEARR